MEGGSSWMCRKTSPANAVTTGNAGPGVWSRCRSAGARPDAGGAAAASSGMQPAGDGQTACLAGDTACRAQDGAELRAGPGDLVSAAALAALDVVPAESRSPVGQQSRRESTEAGGSPSQECAVLSHPERSAGRRSVHEPDPHLPVMRRELLRLPGRAAAPSATADSISVTALS